MGADSAAKFIPLSEARAVPTGSIEVVDGRSGQSPRVILRYIDMPTETMIVTALHELRRVLPPGARVTAMVMSDLTCEDYIERVQPKKRLGTPSIVTRPDPGQSVGYVMESLAFFYPGGEVEVRIDLDLPYKHIFFV